MLLLLFPMVVDNSGNTDNTLVVLVGAVVAIITMFSTVVLAPLTMSWTRRQEKQDDWNRFNQIDSKLDNSIKQGQATHALSNQAYTEALKGIYVAIEMAITAWEEAALARKALGQKPLASTTTKIKQSKRELTKLKKQIAERQEIGEKVVAAVNGK